MYSIYQIGTAGSGKTLLTEKLISLYNDKGNSVASINLDPGVRSLPYTPDFDINEDCILTGIKVLGQSIKDYFKLI